MNQQIKDDNILVTGSTICPATDRNVTQFVHKKVFQLGFKIFC